MAEQAQRERLGRYEILGEIATGGMAEILLARVVGASGFERVVVVKRILPHLARERAFVDMFLDEARTLARIRHPNVVTVHELCGDERDGGALALVMEYLEGESAAGLARRLATLGRALDPLLAAHVVAEASRGLDAAHELTDGEIPLDLVHRDVSPQNVFVGYDGSVKVLDFGIAKAADRTTRTEAGHVKGKLVYMSPEQCLGRPLDRRSDLFALGAVLYELLTGTRAFKRATELLTFQAICEEPVAPPSSLAPGVPASLDRVCARALAKRRDDRYASASEMRRELLAAMRELGRDEDPAELLATTMRELFAERIEEKAEMLRRARGAGAVEHVPRAEVDEAIELPAARAIAEAPTATDLTAPPRPPPARSRGALAGGALAGVIGLATLVYALSGRQPTKQNATSTSSAQSSPFETANLSATPLASTGAPPAAPREITLHVETTPPGARVMIDGRPAGQTPCDVRVARGTAGVELVLERAGFARLTTEVVPDVDQKLLLTLPSAGHPKAPAARSAPADPPKAPPAIEKLP